MSGYLSLNWVRSYCVRLRQVRAGYFMSGQVISG